MVQTATELCSLVPGIKHNGFIINNNTIQYHFSLALLMFISDEPKIAPAPKILLVLIPFPVKLCILRIVRQCQPVMFGLEVTIPTLGVVCGFKLTEWLRLTTDLWFSLL